MKKRTIIFGLQALSILCAFKAKAQLAGPTPLGNYYMDQGLMTLKSYMARTSIGACWGGDYTLWGTGYIGFNLAYDGNIHVPWTYIGDGANNAGATIYANAGGAMMFVTRPSSGGSSGSLTNEDVRNLTRMRIDENGKVAIGGSFFVSSNNTPTPGNYKLYVQDGILTEKVRVAVKNTTDWADYVFKKDYKLMPVSQLNSYIAANNHLPGVPSAEEVVNKGIDLQQMDATLLKKVEELTLYMLQQQKEIDGLKAQLAEKKN